MSLYLHLSLLSSPARDMSILVSPSAQPDSRESYRRYSFPQSKLLHNLTHRPGCHPLPLRLGQPLPRVPYSLQLPHHALYLVHVLVTEFVLNIPLIVRFRLGRCTGTSGWSWFLVPGPRLPDGLFQAFEISAIKAEIQTLGIQVLALAPVGSVFKVTKVRGCVLCPVVGFKGLLDAGDACLFLSGSQLPVMRRVVCNCI